MARKYRQETYMVATGPGFFGWVGRILLVVLVLAVIGMVL
jgi:hypothetical protein